jgi:hypothetical protein
MDGWEASDAGTEELAHNWSSRRERAMVAVGAVVLVGVSLLVGWRLGTSSDHDVTAPATRSPTSHAVTTDLPAADVAATHAIKLVASPFEPRVSSTFDGPEFVATIFNVGDREVRITDVAPGGWPATSSPVTIAAGASAEVPVDVSADCRRTTAPTNEVIVHATSSGRSVVRTLRLPAVPTALTEEYNRLCASPPEHLPRRHELLGVWIVDEADFFAGRMLIRLNTDGTFAMDPFTTLFSDPGKYGRFTYSRGNLVMVSRGGQDCPPGDRSLWRVGLLSDGRLRITLVNSYRSVCRAATGEVWIARRVSPPER